MPPPIFRPRAAQWPKMTVSPALLGRPAESGAHAAGRVQGAQPGETCQGGPRPLGSGEPLFPTFGRPLLDRREELRRPLAAQTLLDVARQALGLPRAPGGKEPGVDHERLAVAVNQRPGPQPGEEIVAVGRRENRVQGVALPGYAHPGDPSQEMQVMVAEHREGPVALVHGPAQHRQRTRPAVDQIAHQPEAVLSRIERDAAQEALEGLEAAVDVADRIGRHGP